MKEAGVSSILIAVVLLALGVIAETQPPKKVPRIGYLSSPDAASESTRAEAIRLALREHGHIEGQTIAIEYRYGVLLRYEDYMLPGCVTLNQLSIRSCANRRIWPSASEPVVKVRRLENSE